MTRHLLLFAVSFPALVASAAAQDPCWADETPCPTGRFEAPAVVVDGELLLFGGFDSPAIEVTTGVVAYDPATGVWSSRASLPSAVTHAGVARVDREVWVAGGFIGDHPGAATANVWVYDVDLDTWSSGPALPRALASGGLAALGRELHWFGGVEADRNTNTGDHWALDLDDLNAGWVSRAPMPDPRCHLSAAAVGNRIHAIGGQYRHDTNPIDLDLHHVWLSATDLWIEAARLPTPRSHFEPGTFVHGGKIFITGGRSNMMSLPTMLDVTAYDPGLDHWNARPSLPIPLLGAGAGVIAGRMIVSTGASATFFPHPDTWSRPIDQGYGGHLRINCGAERYDSPVDGATWCTDFGALSGWSVVDPGVPEIFGTDDDELYRSFREFAGGPVRYRLPMDEGKVRVRLHFAEIVKPGPGQRVMWIELEGEVVRTDLDVFAEVGPDAALVLTRDVATVGSALDVQIFSSVGQPMLSAIEVIELTDDEFEFFCPSLPNSTGQAAEISFQGSGSLGAADLHLLAGPVPQQFGLYFYGQNEVAPAPFGQGLRCIGAPFARLGVTVANGGVLEISVPFGNLPKSGPITAGTTWIFQGWFRDPAGGGASFNSSSALRMRFVD